MRLRQHIQDARTLSNEKDRWVNVTAEAGALEMEIIKNPADRDVDEAQAIRWGRALGLPLLNSYPFPSCNLVVVSLQSA